MSRLLGWLRRMTVVAGRHTVEGLKLYGAMSAGVHPVHAPSRQPLHEWLPDDPEHPGRRLN